MLRINVTTSASSSSTSPSPSCGVDFVRNREEGIDGRRFCELLMPSGDVLNDSVEWVTFDGGYDVGYLIKILTGCRLPDMQEGFFELVSTFFPTVYDVKHLMAFRDGLHGGLNEVAELLGVEQVEACRQAQLAHRSRLQGDKERYFDGSVERYGGSLYDLGRGTLMDPSGGGRFCVRQFNFRELDVDRDVSNPDSVDLLRRSGIDFAKNRERGVDALGFAELLMSSGVVLNDSVQWIAFHGAYDFAYLLKILTCRRLPEISKEYFFILVRTFFPTVYDIKHLMRFCNCLYGGLNKVDAERIGVCHQAGSDSLLTARVLFWRMKEKFFEGSIERYAGFLHGLES